MGAVVESGATHFQPKFVDQHRCVDRAIRSLPAKLRPRYSAHLVVDFFPKSVERAWFVAAVLGDERIYDCLSLGLCLWNCHVECLGGWSLDGGSAYFDLIQQAFDPVKWGNGLAHYVQESQIDILDGMSDGNQNRGELPIDLVQTCFGELLDGDTEKARGAYPPEIFERAQVLRELHDRFEEASGGTGDASESDDENESQSIPVATVVGAFEIVEFLGSGAAGEVYRAHQKTPSRDVALKVLWPDTRTSGFARFMREADALASLEHPSIARLYQTGETEFGGIRRPWIAMEYVRGGCTLAQWGDTEHGDDACIAVVISMADAISYAHGLGVIHCDLKPSNTLVAADGHPVIIDFGLARLRDADPIRSMSMLGERISGTLAYMAPESLNPRTRPDVRTDIFALGAMLYELLAKRPFRNTHERPLPQLLHDVANVDAPRLAHVDRRFIGDLDRIVARATERDPQQRYSTASRFADDLRHHLAGEPVLIELQPLREQWRRALRRNWRVATALVATAALLATTTVISLAFAKSARAQARIANLSAAARAVDSSDLMRVAQHASELEDDGSIEYGVLKRALALRGERLIDGDIYSSAMAPGGSWVVAEGAIGTPDSTASQVAPDALVDFLVRFDGAKERWRVGVPQSPVHGIAISSDGKKIAAVFFGRSLRIYDADTGHAHSIIQLGNPYGDHDDSIAIRSDGLMAVTAGDSAGMIELRLIDAPEVVVGSFEPEIGTVRCMAYSPGAGSRLLLAGHDGAVVVDVASRKVVTRFQGIQDKQMAASWSADGSRAFVAGFDHIVRGYDPMSADPVWLGHGHRDMIWSIAALDDETIASIGAEGSLRLWNVVDGTPSGVIPACDDMTWEVWFDRSGLQEDPKIVFASMGGLSTKSMATLRAWAGVPVDDSRVSVACEKSMAVRMTDGRVRIVSLNGRAADARFVLSPGEGAAERVAIDRDAKLLATVRGDGTLSLVELASGDARWSTKALSVENPQSPSGISALAVDSVGGRVYVASRKFRCVALSAVDGSELWRQSDTKDCAAVAVSADGTRVFTSDRDGVMSVLNARDGTVLRTVRLQRTLTSSMVASADGSRLVAACSDGTLRILDAETLEEQMSLVVSAYALLSVWIDGEGIHTIDRLAIERVR